MSQTSPNPGLVDTPAAGRRRPAASPWLTGLAVMATAALLAACGGGQTDAGAGAKAGAATADSKPAATTPGAASGATPGTAPGAAPGAGAPPVSVTLATARQRDLAVEVDLTGTVVPLASVEVRPQVTASVRQVHAREGQFVRAGDALFTLDARSDEANVARLQAQLAKDNAALADARRQLARNQELVAQNFVSQGVLDASRSQVDAQVAVVAADQASIDAARITLGQARITAPLSGRVGLITLVPGSVVKANDTPMLTITQIDPVDVAFGLPQRYLGDALAALQAGGTQVLASLPERPGTTLRGKLQFIDSAVDASSGTVKVKARFANPQHQLWPGAYVKLSMTVRTLKDAVVVPQVSVIQSPRGAVVYVVKEGKAELRPVQVLHAQGDEAAVSGVQPGERLVVDGRQNLRPGSKVIERAGDGGGKAGGKGGAKAGGPGGAPGAPLGAASAPPSPAAGPGAAPMAPATTANSAGTGAAAGAATGAAASAAKRATP